MVRETNNVCFGQIAQETQVVVREDNKKDHLKRSTEDVSPPNFSERNSGYYERTSRLVSETDSYLKRSNSSSYQSSSSNNANNGNNNKNNNKNCALKNPENRSRTRDRLYRNGPNTVGLSPATGLATSTLLSERNSSGASNKINNSRVPPTTWYEAAATYTNGPGGSGNADVSAAKINHYQTAASTELQLQEATTNSATTSSYTAYSFVSSPAFNNNSNTTTTASTTTSRNSAFYSNLPTAGAVQTHLDKEIETKLTTTSSLLNKKTQKFLKSSTIRSGSISPTSTTLTGGVSGAVSATMTSSSSIAASTPSSSSISSSSHGNNNSNNNNNNNSNSINSSRCNQAANNNCGSVSSTISSSNTNNSLSGNSSSIANTDNTLSSGSSSLAGILNAAALAAAAASKGGPSSTDGHKNNNSGTVANSSSNTSASGTPRSAAQANFHGRSTTSSSRSHSRSPSSFSSSHSSSSSSSSTASSHSHACSPVGGREVESSSATNVSNSRSGTRSLQSAVAVPGASSGLNPSGSNNLCGSSSSSTSSTSSGTPTGNPVVHSEDNRPLAIRVRNLPARSSDTSLKDGLFHEYKKHGKVTWVKVVGQNAERYALVCFKKPEDVEKALEVSHDKLFFGCKIEVEPYQGYDVEDNEFRPYEAELDEYHPKSTRTLFIGNLEKEITASELRQHFECFGEIIEIDIKKQGMSAYAFCQYSDIVSVVKAMRKMDGEHLGNNRIKLGFGKSMPTNCVWIDGIGEKISESHLQSQFLRYGAVTKVVVDRQRQLALVLYEQIQYAQTAVKEMRGATLRGRKLQVDFASRECQDAFYEKLEKQNAGSRFNRYESQSRSRASSFSRHQNSNDGCSPGNTPGSSCSSSAGVLSSTPALSSAIVSGSIALSVSNTTSGITLASVVGQATGNTTPARSRGSRSSRHTMDYEYLDTRRFRSCDEYSQGSATSHDEENTSLNHPSSNANTYSCIGLRSDSPLLSRLGPIVNNSGKESSTDILEMALSRRRCDKSPARQKGDIRLFQKERAVLLEQLEECPSSGDESLVSPRKRIKIDHHSITSSSSSCGLTQSHSLDEQQQPQHKNSNCDYLLNDPMHRKSEVRRLSECNNSLNKYLTPQQNHHHSHHAIQPSPHHHHHQQQLSRRPSNDFMATSGGVAGNVSNMSTRHNSTSSSNSDHHPLPHQSSSSASSLACKRRRIIGSGSNTIVSASSLLSGSTGGVSNFSSFAHDDSTHHSSKGRGHQLHSHHSQEASGGESADGSRPGTPLCDERPEVLPSEPRRVPRERPREPMVLPLPKFGIQFFQQYRNNPAAVNATSYHHHISGSFVSSSASLAGNMNSGSSSHLLSNSILNRGEIGISSNNSHSSLSHSSTTTTPTSVMPTGSSSGTCYLPNPSTRFPFHWRPLHHHHQPHGGGLHGPSGGATPSSSSSMVSPMRSRSLSSNSSDSDAPGQSSTGSPSLEERIRTLDEMYERWSGGGNSGSPAIGPNVVKRHDFNSTPPTWQHHRSNMQLDTNYGSNSDLRCNANPPTPSSRHKFLDIDVHEMQPSDIVKSVLAKKSIFDDDLQRLKKNHWYEPSSDSSQLSKATTGLCTSPGLPNLQATKTPVVGCTTSLQSLCTSSSNKPSSTLLQRLTSLSPMNSPQTSMSPYNSPSPSSSVILSSVALVTTTTIPKVTSVNSYCVPVPQAAIATTAASTSPTSAGGTKCLQYPFPTHPPLPNTAVPLQNTQPIPPPPAESSKPPMTQPPLPPMEVLKPPQPPALSPTSSSTTSCTSTKPKTSALSKSLSVPTPPHSTVTTESRLYTKSVSVPGSTNLGTVKSTADSSAGSSIAFPHLEQSQPQQTATGNSSLLPSKSHNKDDDSIVKPPIHFSSASTSDSVVKRYEKSHKHNHRSSEEKKSKNDKRKNLNALQISHAPTADLSDADESESKKERKERQERRDKELRKQQERDEREREERESKEKVREEKERLENEYLEKEKLEKVELEKERSEKEERERLQCEKEHIRKEEQRVKEERDRERKEKEEKERKLYEQREREDKERREREHLEKLEREEREELLRKEKKEREENEQKGKEKLERRIHDEKERERKSQEESNSEQKRDINLLKEIQRRKENAASQIQTKTSNDMATVTSQTAHEFFHQGETEQQNNKENSTVEDATSTTILKHKNRKASRNASPVRYPKRRLSSQESNASNSEASNLFANAEDHAKRMRIDLPSTTNQPQPIINNHNTLNNAISERRDIKEHNSKDRTKQNRVTTLSQKCNTSNTSQKEHNTKHHRSKHHHKTQTTASQGVGETNDVNLSKTQAEHMTPNCTNKSEDNQQNTQIQNHEMELKPKISPILSSEDEEPSESMTTSTPHHNKNVSNHHKHREHGSSHHSRHKSNKREREHHRDKKRHSTSAVPQNSASVNESVPSTPPSASCNVTDEENIPSSGNHLSHRRISGNNTGLELNIKNKNDVPVSKLSRCSDDSPHPHTPSQRQNNKTTPQSSSKRLVLSSAEDTDGGGVVVSMGPEDDNDSDNRQHSIFDIPDDGPYVSMYDKVKARSCKNMQKQEEEKKIKAKFSQLKQSRAKREEKKRSTSYDGDSDSDFEGVSSEHQKQHNQSGSSFKMLTTGLSSTEDEQNMDTCDQTPSRERRRSSQASSSTTSVKPHQLCSDSDDNSVAQRRVKLQDNLRRLCDDGDETSEDDLIRRHNTGFANKRLLHHTSRIASDSESQSQSAIDIKLKQEPVETSNDGANTPIPVLKHLKHNIKKEIDSIEQPGGETGDFGEFKLKRLNSMYSSADEQVTVANKIKTETSAQLLSANEIKNESKDFYADEYLQPDKKVHLSAITSASQPQCTSEQIKTKKHKKSKKRQKTPTQDFLGKEQVAENALVKHSSQANNVSLLTITNDTKILTPPCFDAFDELKRGETLVAHTSPDLQITGERKRHKDRKEKKREKLRLMSADIGSGAELDKMVYEKEKHRLKKSKKSKSVDLIHQNSTSSSVTVVNQQKSVIASAPTPTSCTSHHKQRSGGEKMEDIFGPISDEDEEELTDSDIGGRDLNCILNRNTSSSNMPGPQVSAALNPYKQEPLTPKSHTVEENEENKQKLTCSTIMGTTAHLERVAERQHRKEKREKKRKEREKSRSSEHNQSIGYIPSPAMVSTKPMEDENSVDLDAAGRALEAQLMEDSDNKTLEDATPSTANTYRSDMTDVFLFSDCDENSLELSSTIKHEKKETEKEQTPIVSCKSKEKKKKKKRSKEEKQLHHQRRESSSSNASQLAPNMVAPTSSSSSTTKLTIDVQTATKFTQKTVEEQSPPSTLALCKPSPSLPCLIGDDDEDMAKIQSCKSTFNTSLLNVSTSVCTTPHRSSSKDMLSLSPHMKDKQMISPIPKTPTTRNNTNSGPNTSENLNKKETASISTPTSSMTGVASNEKTTPTSSIGDVAKSLNSSNPSCNSNVIESPTSSAAHNAIQKKKPEIFIPGFDGEIDERISESAVQSISAGFNTPLDSMADEPKIPVESPPDALKLEKLEETKSRVTISQEETESAVSALLGESFGNSSADYSFNDDDDDGLADLNNTITDPEPVMVPGEPDEEAALAAKAIECEVASSALTDTVDDETEEVCKAIQNLRQEELDIKVDTPQSVRDLQIDTDTEENVDEADSSGSHSLKIDETAQSNNSSTTSEKADTSNQTAEEPIDQNKILKSSVITKVTSPTTTKSVNTANADLKIEPPTINKQDQPAIQPVQDVLQSVASTTSASSISTVDTSSSLPTSLASVAISYTSTPIKTSLVSTSMSSSPTKLTHVTSGKPFTSAAAVTPISTGYVMQPPTISIPEPTTHFAVPQLVLSPRGLVASSHQNDSLPSSSSTHSPSGNHMPPQSPVAAAYLMGVRSQSPHSPRQHISRGNTPTPRQASPQTTTPTATPPPIAVTPQQQQQNILIHRTVQQHQQKLMTSPSQGHASQISSPLASPIMQQRQIVQGGPIHKVTQQQTSPNNCPEQQIIKVNNYSTPTSQTLNVVNIRIPPSSQQQHSQQTSPKQGSGKSVIEPQQQQQHVPIGQHILPISVQKIPPVQTHPTIISKVVTVTPQQAQQSMMQQSPGAGVNMFSPPSLSGNTAINSARQNTQIIQQMGGKTIHQQQQQSSQLQFMQQQQRQQQHMLQMQQQHIIHQQQKLPLQQQGNLVAQQQQQQQSQHNFVVSQQRNLGSPQQVQQQSQNPQQNKGQYQQQQMLTPSQQSPTQQQNVIQNSPIPQRFLVQQHIVGMSQPQQPHMVAQQQQQRNPPQSQLQSSNPQQKLSPIYSGKQQQPEQQQQHYHLQHSQQTPSQQRFQQQQQAELIKEPARVIISNNQSNQQNEVTLMTSATSKENAERSSSSPTTSMAVGNKQAEGVSVIRTPTPTSSTISSTTSMKTLTQNASVDTSKEPPTPTPILSKSRSVPLTEENVIKISAPKHDDGEQDSKEDSDYWSAKELNVVENNITLNPNATSVSTVIKKTESICTSEAPALAPTATLSTLPKEQRKEETKSPQNQNNKNDTNFCQQVTKNDIHSLPSSEPLQGSMSTATYSSQISNATTDHDTEDETETQQMSSFEQVLVQGKPSTRGTGAKRGRQPRGGKKSTTSNGINTQINANANTEQLPEELNSAVGVQTRLRKPNAGPPAVRGRKGRPPRNLLLQQQLQQKQHEQVVSTPQTLNPATQTSSSVVEKKSRSQTAGTSTAMTLLSETNQQQQQQDVYEFHDESGDEIKTSSALTSTSTSAVSSDHRPRLILTIKSPAQGATPLVKASEKSVNIEETTTKPIVEQTTAVQTQENKAYQSEATAADLAAAANTRKSRRLLEKDRSTIDDIIEDVVRNTVTNAAVANAATNFTATTIATNVTNLSTSTLPKGAQTPPRRSGRNSSQSKPLKAVDPVPQTNSNPIGRPRKSKDRKNTSELEIEQVPSPQPKNVVHEEINLEDRKSVTTPSPSVEACVTQITHSQQQQPPQPSQVSSPNTTNNTNTTPQNVTAIPSTIPQHPKKKALAAAEIEIYQTSTAPITTTTAASSTTTPNINSSLPAGGVPMLNTAAPATQKTTGGAADSVNKPLMDPVTGVVSGLQMQQAKEGNLPSATAASQPLRAPSDPKKMMLAAAAAAAAENVSIKSKLHNQSSSSSSSLTGSVATPITAFMKPVNVEATAAQIATSTVATAMLNKSVSVVVKTSVIPPTSSPQSTIVVQQQQHSQQQREDIAASTKQPIIMQQQTTSVMHAQHTNIRPPTSLKAHVLNSQKLQQQQQQQNNQQLYLKQQQSHQVLQQHASTNQSGMTHQSSSHVMQNTIVQARPTTTTSVTTASVASQQQQQLTQATKQLLVNIPPVTTHSSQVAANALNSPRHLTLHSQQQSQSSSASSQHSLVIKQTHDMHTPQVLHVVSSKTTAPSLVTNKSGQSTISVVHQQPPNASPHHSYTSYIQTLPGAQTKQQLPQQPVVIHQQTLGVQSKTTTTATTPLVMPPGILTLPPHPAMVIQTKASAPAQSPSTCSTATNTSHLQHTNHAPSPPLQHNQQQHLVKSLNNSMMHSIQTQGVVPHNLNAIPSPSSPSAVVKPNAQQSSIASNVGASSLRTAIPTISPQSQARIGSILLPAGMQVPPHFETSMHDIATYGSAVTGSVRTTQSPPPAHQQASPITPSETSFPGGMGRVGVPSREHLMIYQQLLRQHDSLNPAALREYDEKLLGSSPPLELRRPGSVPRTVTVPHSLQSPQDRSTDSPQVAQVYVHNTRIPAHSHFDVTSRPAVTAQPTGYYDASRQLPLEPPPAHRSATVHTAVAPSTVVAGHPAAGNNNAFMPVVPPTSATVQAPPSSTPHHSKILERERDQRDREREQQLLREKEQIMVRAGTDAHSMQVSTPPPHQQASASHQLPPPHAQQPPPQADSLLTLLQRYPVMWQGLLALKTDQAAVQMHFVFGNPHVARASLPCNSDGSTPPLRIAQRMRLEQTQLEGVAKKMQFENEHCMLLALPCGRDHADVLQQSRNLQSGFITYLQQKMAAGIVNIPMPGSEQAAYVVHIFPSCDFANENLEKAAPDLKNRVADIAHLLIVIATV